MKERVRLMKCQNKKKNVKRAVAGIIFLSVIAIILSAYGVTPVSYTHLTLPTSDLV